MRKNNYWADIVIFLVIGLLSVTAKLYACTMSFPNYTVEDNFIVDITYQGRPLRGIEAEVTSMTTWKKVTSVLSNEQGRALVRGLTPGRYFLAVKHLGTPGEAAELKVVSKPSSVAHLKSELTLSWPANHGFEVQGISGTMAVRSFDRLDDRNRNHDILLRSADLTLSDALSGKVVKVFNPDNKGNFTAGDLKPAFYILHVLQKDEADENKRVDGYIFIEVNKAAKGKQLPYLALSMSTCGMGYQIEDEEMIHRF